MKRREDLTGQHRSADEAAAAPSYGLETFTVDPASPQELQLRVIAEWLRHLEPTLDVPQHAPQLVHAEEHREPADVVAQLGENSTRLEYATASRNVFEYANVSLCDTKDALEILVSENGVQSDQSRIGGKRP